MPEPVRARPDASGDQTPAILLPGPASDLTEFARTCRAAARAVSLYPGGHPAIDATLSRLARLAAGLTDHGPFRLQVLADRLLIDGAGLPRPEASVVEMGALLHRHLIGSLTVNAGAGADSWRTLLLLLARTPDDVRADGGIGRLWATAGGPSIEIQEIDYAEVLREKHGLTQAIDDILSAALAGPQFEFDEELARMLRDVLDDPAKLDALMLEIERVAGARGVQGPHGAADILLNLIRGMVKADPDHMDAILERFSNAARRLSAGSMLAFIGRRGRPEALVGEVDVAAAVLDRMDVEKAAGFVAASVTAEHGATERLAHAFSALVPDVDRQRQVLGLARIQLASAGMGEDEAFPQLWQGVESMLALYTDAPFVSTDYARELSSARTQPVDVDHVRDDPPERIAGWLASVGDATLRALDHALLADLLVIEADPLRWRDMAETVVAHADDLVRVGYFDQAWELVEGVIAQGAASPARQFHATSALERFGRGAMMKHVATHLRQAGDAEYNRFSRLCHAIGTAVITPLAEALTEEQDAHARLRLREILIGFGPRGRESVQQLMHSTSWQVRRTAAYLLREFGGTEGLKELIPLLTDPEPLVKREAVQGLMLNGSLLSADILLGALTRASAVEREALGAEILGVRDERASMVLCHLVRRLDRRALARFYLGALDALGTSRAPDTVAALDLALRQRDWRTPLRNRRFRAAAAQSLGLIGTPAALDALRAAAADAPPGSRLAARAALAGLQ